MLLAYRGFEQWRGEHARAWLLAIVRNSYITRLRRDAPHARLTDSLDDDAFESAALIAADDPEAALMAAHAQRSLDAALHSLPPLLREVLILRELEELSYRDIASITAVPIGTVMSRLARARAALKARWSLANGEAR